MSAISGRHGSVEKHLYSHSDSSQSPRASVINRGEDGYQMQPHTGTRLCTRRILFQDHECWRARRLYWRRAQPNKSQLVPEPPAGLKPWWNYFHWQTKRYAASSCSYAIMKMAMAIIAGKGPIAGYLITNGNWTCRRKFPQSHRITKREPETLDESFGLKRQEWRKSDPPLGLDCTVLALLTAAHI